MEQQAPEQIPEAPEKERSEQSKKLSLTLPPFLTAIGRDVRWYYDVRLWLPLILILVILAACTGSKLSAAPSLDSIPTESPAAETLPLPAETQAAPQLPYNPDAEALAILADSVGDGRSENVKTIIMWVAINRSEDRANGHGLTLREEIDRPNQWQGYDPEKDYSERTYEIALEVLAIRDTGRLRPLDGDMLWMVLNDDGSVTLRNQFTNNGSRHWREKTIK